jgi:hypothetical protein
MRKLGGNRDSLELLLDTVCSMFGAILLIAILVALMAQTSHDDNPGERAGVEIFQRKIAATEADLAETRRLITRTGAPSSTTAVELAAEKRQLVAAIAGAKSENDRVQSQLQAHITRQMVDYSAEWKRLVNDQRDFTRQQNDLENEIKMQDQKAAEFNSQARDSTRAIKAEKESRVVSLRFPKEHAGSKRPLPVICKFGRIFPLMDADGKKNEATVVWKKKDSGEMAKPVEALGWILPDNKGALEDLFNAVHKSEYYITFVVYPDSFDVYHSVRDMVTAAQLDFGMELDRAGSELIFGAEGSTPPPL